LIEGMDELSARESVMGSTCDEDSAIFERAL
jgi:hypothetical protein